MTKETDFLIQSFSRSENSGEMTLDQLKGYSEAFPYSSIVQFLYTRKLKTLNHPDFPEAVSKSALFFNSPQWLYLQLCEDAENGSFGIDIGNFHDIETGEANYLKELPAIAGEDAIGQNMAETTETMPISQEELQIAFEPYHTIDYFASQGIKVNLENEKDDLSRKVKSFTSWLKTMKRLQPGTENHLGKDFPSILDTTNKEEDSSETIVTEAMAEVYIKQGLRDKAMEVYTKLSLQNPVNSHIFADKISQLKENRI